MATARRVVTTLGCWNLSRLRFLSADHCSFMSSFLARIHGSGSDSEESGQGATVLLLRMLKLCYKGHLATLGNSWAVSWDCFLSCVNPHLNVHFLSLLPQRTPVPSWPQTLNRHLTQKSDILKTLCLETSLKCFADLWLTKVRNVFLCLN